MTFESAKKLVASSRPQTRFWRGPMLALLGLSILLGAAWADPARMGLHGSAAWIVPQVLLLVIVALITQQFIRQRRVARHVNQAFESIHRRDWPEAQEQLCRLLEQPIRRPALRAQCLLGLAIVAEKDHEYEASQYLCEQVLEEGHADPVQHFLAQVQLGSAMLRTGQTADAVDLIDRLASREVPAALKAQVQMLALFREVVLGHAHETLDRADERRALFRSQLSTQAGYGYGLLAAAFDRANRTREASAYWRDATLLVPVDDLVQRFGELAPVAERYPAVEAPF